MSLFHFTSDLNAKIIVKKVSELRSGTISQTETGQGLPVTFSNNICLSSKPYKIKGRIFCDDTIFANEIPDGVINKFELVETGKAIREFLAPATLLDCYEPAVVTGDY